MNLVQKLILKKTGAKTSFLILSVMFIFISGCNQRKGGEKKQPSGIAVRYAKNFNLVDKGNYVVLQLLQPETGKVEVAYALVKRGEDIPVPADLTKIEIPVKNIAVLSTTHIGMLSALDQLGVVKGSTSAKYVSNAEIKSGIQSGKIAEYSDESSVSPASLVHDKIDLVVYSGFGGEFPNTSKLKKLNVFTMANYDWREQHPLGKAEWIKVFGYLTGTEEKATVYFEKVVSNYLEMKQSVSGISGRKKVMVGSLICDVWYAPAGESYMAQILKDAGADYVYAIEKGTGSTEKSFAQVLRDQADCTYWINPGAASITDLFAQNGKYNLFTAVKSKNVYCYTKNSNYFWEMSAVNPDWILSDFSVILGSKKSGKLHFYSKLN